MKCPNCKQNIFEGQFRCHHCGTIVVAEEKPEKEEKKTQKKEK